MRTLFFGTSAFAVPSLRVVAERTMLAGVVTQPDRPAGRGQKLVATPVKAAALELGLRVFEPLDLRTFIEALRTQSFDLFVLASYGKILPQGLLDLPRLGALNVHPSLLPKYRGATPIQSALRAGERETGVSIMMMDAGMDTGPLVRQERVAIGADENYGSLHDRLALEGARLLADSIVDAQSAGMHPVAQRGDATVTRPLRKADLAIDWSWPSARIVDTVRAFSPQPGARADMDGETVKILRAHVGANDRVVIDELIAPNRGRMSGEAYDRSRTARRL